MSTLTPQAIALLQSLIATPSFSREEEKTAGLIDRFLKDAGVATHRKGHNIWAFNRHYDENKPNVLLNSHHDTVKPVAGWTKDPFSPDIEEGTLYGLGSNDAGGPLVSLIATFLHFYEREDLPFNLILAATAEEEISGANGIAAVLPELPEIAVGIIGEPTQIQLAIAERGLMVDLDCVGEEDAVS